MTTSRSTMNRVVRLRNETCPYCGRDLEGVSWDDDHVIARGLVPKGTLLNVWNLKLRACVDCNGKKSDLEDDIPAVSMQPTVTGRYARHDDERLRAEARRKGARSKSRMTGSNVVDSSERMKLEGSLVPGARVSFGLVAPPQLDRERILKLAEMQVCAFFYWKTFDQDTRRGARWPGGFFPLGRAMRTDWGNVLQKGFMRAVLGWEEFLIRSTAEGFFKVAIRQHPEAPCWSWALEWNENIRVVGFFGEEERATTVIRDLPTPAGSVIRLADGSTLELRREIPLTPSDDVLFNAP